MAKHGFDYKDIQDALHRQADRLHKLADKLSDSGKPLGAMEKTEIREAIASGWVKDLQDEQRYFFQRGNLEDYEQSSETIAELLIILS